MSIRTSPRFTTALTLLVAGYAALPEAHAHPTTVDGMAGDWLASFPEHANAGRILRNAAGQGEYLWLDATADTRTDIATPEDAADITGVQVTGDATGMSILVRLAAGAATPPVQVQVALDLDRVAGSGQSFLAGFADTEVDNAARWEFLAQTQFGSGGTAQLIDSSFTQVTTLAAAQGTDGVELFVPWTSLGLGGPPAAPVRLSIATFRAAANDDTIDVGGPGISNALDVLSDFGDPTNGPFPNTFDEVSDQVLNHFVDIPFNAQGEVVAPVLISRVLPNAATEWITLHNPSGVAVDISGWKVGDAETPDNEGMLLLPAATVLAPNGTYVIADDGAAYQALVGTPPDADQDGTGGVQLVEYGPWDGGIVGLANGGDEVLLVDAQNTIVDVVAYGTATYSGTTSAPAAPSGQILARDPLSQDTDDASLDFVLGPICGASIACATCSTCNIGACLDDPLGTSCADGNACNGDEACDGMGTCAAGTPLDCDDMNLCTADSCNPATGCVNAPEMAGLPCGDNNVCNGTDECDGAGTCVTSAPLDCDDLNPCTDDTCDPIGGCSYVAETIGTPCSDNDACNGAELCNGAGTCMSNPPPDCTSQNPCTVGMCEALSGCVQEPLSAGTPCDDGDPANGADECDGAGVCTPLGGQGGAGGGGTGGGPIGGMPSTDTGTGTGTGSGDNFGDDNVGKAAEDDGGCAIRAPHDRDVSAFAGFVLLMLGGLRRRSPRMRAK